MSTIIFSVLRQKKTPFAFCVNARTINGRNYVIVVFLSPFSMLISSKRKLEITKGVECPRHVQLWSWSWTYNAEMQTSPRYCHNLHLCEVLSKSVHKIFGTKTKVFPKIASVTITLDLSCWNAHLSHILSYLCEVISKSVHRKGAGTKTAFFLKKATWP